MDESLARRAVEVNYQSLALGHEVFEADSATFVRNLAFPGIYDANVVFKVRASQPRDIEQLLDRAAREYAHAARLTFRVDPFTPAALEARLLFEGYGKRPATAHAESESSRHAHLTDEPVTAPNGGRP